MTENPRPTDAKELVELIRSIDLNAPPRLHERVAAMVAERERHGATASPAGLRLRVRLGAAAAVLAAAAVAIALSLSGSGPGRVSLEQASAVTLGAATMPAPAESASARAQLTVAVEGVGFPYWGERFDWRSAGSRVDRLGGRTVETVFYRDGKGHTIGYAIVAGTPAPSFAGGTVVRRSGTSYWLHTVGSVKVLTWTRDGRLCVISGRGLDAGTLLALASWDEQPRVT